MNHYSGDSVLCVTLVHSIASYAVDSIIHPTNIWHIYIVQLIKQGAYIFGPLTGGFLVEARGGRLIPRGLIMTRCIFWRTGRWVLNLGLYSGDRGAYIWGIYNDQMYFRYTGRWAFNQGLLSGGRGALQNGSLRYTVRSKDVCDKW